MKLDKVSLLIKKSSLIFDKMANSVLEKYDLTAPQYKVMIYLYAEYEDGVRTVDLEKFYSMTHPTTIGILQNLEKKGLVEYRKNPDDARSRFIVPTKKAIEMRAELESVGANLNKGLTHNLTERENRKLIELLRKMVGLEQV